MKRRSKSGTHAGRPRKQSRSGQDETSVRSQSQDIASELADGDNEDRGRSIRAMN